MAEYPIARLYTDARVPRIYGGTTEIMNDLIARRHVHMRPVDPPFEPSGSRISTPLTGVRVIEFEGFGPGPIAGRMPAGMGAEVTVIARPQQRPVNEQLGGQGDSPLRSGKGVVQLPTCWRRRHCASKGVHVLQRCIDLSAGEAVHASVK